MDSGEYFDGYGNGHSKPWVLLDDWSMVPSGGLDPYKAPELLRATLHGRVTGHPLHVDGTYVTTSLPLASNGREIETHNTIYNLGLMSEGYGEWCFHNGVEIDPMAPVKIERVSSV